MEKRIIGFYSSPWRDVSAWIYDDYTVSKPWFFSKKTEERFHCSDKGFLEFWGLALNSPWMPEDDKISDSFSEFETGYGFTYKREVIGFEMMTGTIYSREPDRELAEKELNKLFSEIQEKYNPENDSI